MKTIYSFTLITAFLIFSCKSEVKPPKSEIEFGIYEIINKSSIPSIVLDSLKVFHVIIENDSAKSVLGYINQTDSSVFNWDISRFRMKIFRLNSLIKDKIYYGIIPVSIYPGIDNTCISETKVKGKNVEIYLNYDGAKKWANLTRKNIGKQLALTINKMVYSMPYINGVIMGGVAVLNTESEMEAKSISDMLNSNIYK